MTKDLTTERATDAETPRLLKEQEEGWVAPTIATT